MILSVPRILPSAILAALPFALLAACSTATPADSPEADGGAIATDAGSDASVDAAVDASVDAAVDAAIPADAGGGDSGLGDASLPVDAGIDAADGSSDAGVVVDLYDPAIVPKFELTLAPDAIATLSSTAAADQKTWVHGTFRYGGKEVVDVGIRRKGSSTFRALPGKASLKVRFDKYVNGQTFAGLHELTLNNMVSDETGLAERLSYHLFRAAGLPAQRANSATVAINGDNYGLYANIETPNKDFIKRAFGANTKTLYEADYGQWIPNDGSYSEEVGDGTKADLTALFAAVAATTDANLPNGVAANLDVTEWLRFSAAEGVIGDRDGYAFSIYSSHNYFLAGNTNGVLSLVPWSLDLTFEDNPRVVVTAPKPAYPTGEPTLLKRCKQSPACWATYKAQVSSVLQVFQAQDLGALAQTWHAQIDGYQRNDPKRESTISTYDAETNKLYGWIAARPAVVTAQLAAP